MTISPEEDEAFNEIERRAKQRKESVRAAMRRVDEDDDIQIYQRPWVGLTDEEIKHIEETTTCLENESWLRNLTRNLEAKLKEKNI